MLLLLENFDNAEAQRHITGTLDLSVGAGKGGSNAAVLDYYYPTYNKIQFIKSTRVVIGFYTLDYSEGYVHFGNHACGLNFKITFNKGFGGLVNISFYNPEQNEIINYPIINDQTAYQDTDTGYSLIEIYLDLTHVETHQGEVKIAIDGIEYVNLSNIVNARINLFGSGLDSPEACYAYIAFEGFPLIDSLYICNEGKGFNNDFLGPFDIATLAPRQDGDYSNWERREYSTSVDSSDGRENTNFVSKIPFNPDDAEYKNVIASQTLVQDLFYFSSSNIPNDKEIMALEHRVWHKGLSQDQLIDFSLITPIAKASGREIVSENLYEDITQPFYFQQMRTPYDVVPTVATTWTRENLENTQFGYCFYETGQFDAAGIASLSSTDLIQGSLNNIVDGNEFTSIRAEDITFIFDDPIKIRQLKFKASSSHTFIGVHLYDESWNEFSFDSQIDVGWDYYVLENPRENYDKEIKQITIDLRSDKNLFLIQVIAWEKITEFASLPDEPVTLFCSDDLILTSFNLIHNYIQIDENLFLHNPLVWHNYKTIELIEEILNLNLFLPGPLEEILIDSLDFFPQLFEEDGGCPPR